MKIALSRIHYPVRTLGPGARIGIWFQGCSIRCPGCVSMDTWVEGQHVTTLDEVKEGLLPFLALSDGVTISGGEPFDQPETLLALLQWLRDVHSGDIFVYSGYTYEALQQHLVAFDGLIDAVMTDPFRQDIGQTLALPCWPSRRSAAGSSAPTRCANSIESFSRSISNPHGLDRLQIGRIF
jgi:anaerobic ribonucleoside-triphosphate reductase activating protein